MKNYLFLVILVYCFCVKGQTNLTNYDYEPTEKYPFGQVNPDAPKEVADFEPLIGLCDCLSIARIDKNTWADTVDMTWRFKYIMNGLGVQDETLKADGKHSGSIRQFIADSASWYVHYYSSNGPTTTLSTWEGNKTEDGNIVLYRDNPAPNGTEGNYRLTFYDISEDGYNWVGEWTTKDESIVYPTWKIFCKKRNN